MKPLVCLAMILKNEAKSIGQVLDAALPWVDEAIFIVDSATTDDTAQICLDTCVKHHVPSRSIEHHWLGYMGQRNIALDLANHPAPCEFALMLSGDEILQEGQKLRDYLEAERNSDRDLHFIKMFIRDVMTPQPRIFRSGSAWRYYDFDCGIHEVPCFKKPDGTWATQYDKAPVGWSGVVIDHEVADPIRRLESIENEHIPLLHASLERNGKNPRALELLAQSYESLIPYAEDDDERAGFAAICLQLYQRRFELPMHDVERNVLSARYLDDARLTGIFPPATLLALAEELCKRDPLRPEPAVIRADVATKVDGITAQKVYDYALEAVRVAVNHPNNITDSLPITISSLWKAHRIACIAARQLGRKHPEYVETMHKHAQAALEAGGPREIFRQFLPTEDAA
jgi:glycosyltransferase involved in cell wall biosynthesis